MSGRWRTPREWVRTRKLIRHNQTEGPGTCGACGRYLKGYNHMHYTLRWLSGFRRSNA